MTSLDLRLAPPRNAREPILGFYFLARTIDKLRAQLPGGNLGAYLNEDIGFSAYVVRRLGLAMDDFRAAVAAAPAEEDVVDWLATRIDLRAAPALNAKLETFVVDRMSSEDQLLVRRHHPVMAQQPELTSVLDVLDADDRLTFSAKARSH